MMELALWFLGIIQAGLLTGLLMLWNEFSKLRQQLGEIRGWLQFMVQVCPALARKQGS